MLTEGQRLGDFEILGQIGQGGMGAVFKARQTSLHRIVALKTLKPFVNDDPDYVARFHQEAVAAAAINHPNLVQVYAAGEAGNIHFFAMEYVEGESAQGRLERQGRVEPLEVIAIATHVAAALEHGWRKAGLIHRDIKPDNIFLSMDGEVKLGDLGLAKSAGQSMMTQTGTAIGTPHYLSPEQAEGKRDIDFRTDIYSLGCTIYHLLSGQPPYVTESAMATMLKHVSAPVPDLCKVWPECPKELAALVMKMMQKAPADRFQSYAEVSAELRRIYDLLSGHSVPNAVAATKPGGEKRPMPVAVWIGGGLAVCAAVGVLLFFAPWKKGAQPLPTVASHERPPTAQNTGAGVAPAADRTPAATPGGGTLAGAPSPLPAITPPPRPPVAEPSTHVASAPVESTPAPQATPKPMTEVEKWFAQVDGPQQEAFQKQVIQPFETGLADLRARYLSALDAAIARASAGGKLDEALAWRTERQAFVQAQNVAADDTGVPAGALALRASFRQQLAKLDQARLTKAKALYAEYDAVLEKNQTLLTQRQRLDDALLLKTKREEIANVWLAPSPLAAAGAAVSPAPASSATGELPVTSSAAGKDATFVNTLGMKFVPVPILGGPTAGQRLLFSVWDTRVQDYEAFVKETKRQWPKVDFEQGPTHPVVMVSWQDAQLFCQWLTAREKAAGRLPAGWSYRLPSDHEWSCAVGIGEQEDPAILPAEKSRKIRDAFPWGTQWPPPDNSGNYASEELKPLLEAGKFPKVKQVMPGYHDGFATTSPVGSYAANRFGLYDMGGNVWNWCEDWVDEAQKSRVLRGASWNFCDRLTLLSSHRYAGVPALRDTYYGFRCALVAPTAGPQAGAGAVGVPADFKNSSNGSATATRDRPFVNALGMKFVPVPITYGPTAGQRVLFSIWDTRVQDYQVFAEETRRDWQKPDFEQGPTHPAVDVNWEDAKAFCAWLTERERKAGKLGANEEYRLPSDQEWSNAVGLPPVQGATPAERNGKNPVEFPWGQDFPPANVNVGNYRDETWHEKFPAKGPWIKGYTDGYANTSPVGTFPANRFGLYDMGGNVWQWCEDWYDLDQKRRVLRGASWTDSDRGTLLLSHRTYYGPEGRIPNYGFRCVLAASAAGSQAGAVGASTDLKAPSNGSATATKENPFVNTLGMKFVPVPITHGPTAGHRVLFSIWDTRVQDYQVFADETRRDWPKPDFEQDPTHPAVNVTWDDAKAFCAWLTERERKAGKLTANEEYRLPSDQEWSNAVGLPPEQGATPMERSGKNAVEFPWGQDFPPAKANVGNYRDETWHAKSPNARLWLKDYTDGYVNTAPVGSFPANRFGLYDMGGNVWQWCEDWFDPSQQDRVVRGASWDNHDRGSLLSSHRTRHPPTRCNPSYGFRCVLGASAR